ncbi:hypothetical protein CUMW_264380 [Citrus unshiu]|uniref:Uncharacterized protein n=1 Tax=Citrus unshiu TaxID=55188 RepID=A0A2H5QV67_CITUN|nr:hypothetical protein CUMW_264380 [Citrus unshiu]
MTKRISAWDVIRKILPDNQNGSRVLITLAQIEIVTSFQFENGENIGLDFVPTGGALRATYQGWPFHILYHGSISLEENIDEIAEGFISDNNEATAEKYLEQLINRGFVKANKRRAGGTINTCSIPGRCHPVLLGVASESIGLGISCSHPISVQN